MHLRHQSAPNLMEMNFIYLAFLLLAGYTAARPQDLQTGVLLAASQLKELMETGGGARSDHSVEIFGQKLHNGMDLGFGDSMLPAGRRRRRSPSELQFQLIQQQVNLLTRQLTQP